MFPAVAAVSVSWLLALSSVPTSLPQDARPVPAAPAADAASDVPKPSGSPVPEPATLLLVGTGLVGLALSSRRWRRAPR